MILYIAICDDNADFCIQIADMLADIPNLEKAHQVVIFHSGEELLFQIEDHKFDLLLLDIVFRPGEMSGMKIAENIRRRNMELPIIFLSDYPEYALQGYHYHPYHFLYKQNNRNELRKAVYELESRKYNDWNSCLNFKVRGGFERVPKDEIVHIEVQNHTLSIYTEKKVFRRSHIKITDVLDDLSDPRFFQTHKSFIINLDKMQRITDGYISVLMKNEKVIPISQGRKQQMIRYVAWFDTRARGNYELRY